MHQPTRRRLRRPRLLPRTRTHRNSATSPFLHRFSGLPANEEPRRLNQACPTSPFRLPRLTARHQSAALETRDRRRIVSTDCGCDPGDGDARCEIGVCLRVLFAIHRKEQEEVAPRQEDEGERGEEEDDEGEPPSRPSPLAGFPTVVGTLWHAYEDSAIKISSHFYRFIADQDV